MASTDIKYLTEILIFVTHGKRHDIHLYDVHKTRHETNVYYYPVVSVSGLDVMLLEQSEDH